MKQIIILISAFLITASAVAQQESHFTQFMHNQLTLNPAYAGARGVGSFMALYRKQWVGFDGAPETALLSFNSPFISRSVGIGVTLENQKIGIFDNLQATLAYSYNIRLGNRSGLRIGIQGSAKRYQMDLSDPSVIIRHQNDPSVPLGETRDKIYGNFGVGLFLQVKNFYIGASIPNFYKNQIGFVPSSTAATEVPHIYGMAGTIIDINDDLDIRPAILVKALQNAPFDLDANISLMFKKRFMIGGSYRLGGEGKGESVDLVALWQLTDRLALGFGYDYTLTKIRKSTDGSFEVLAWFDLKRTSSDIANPRFFF